MPSLGMEEASAAAAVIESGCVKAGPKVRELQDEFTNAMGAYGAAACSSGTQGLHLALRVLGIGPGDEVALSSYVCRQVYDAIVLAGAKPLLCDASIENFGIDPTDLGRKRTSNTRGMIQAHLFGTKASLDAPEFGGLVIIEDACQRLTHPLFRTCDSTLNVPVRVYSFEATKAITCGEGGILLVKDRGLFQRAHDLSQAVYRFPHGACPVPLTDIQAAVALVQWNRYPEFLVRRTAIAEEYRRHFPAGQKTGFWEFCSAPAMDHRDTVPYRWVGWTHRSEELIAAAENLGIGIKRPVKPVALHSLFGGAHGQFAAASSLMEGIVSLPLYPALSDGDLHRVIDFMCRGE